MVKENHLIELIDVSKDFNGSKALKNISLYIREGEFVTLLGPSGCGKTTTLRIIGGFEAPSSGQVLFNGENIQEIPPYKRPINTVFQKYALFPHMNVFDNIAFGLKMRKVDKSEIADRVNAMLQLVELKDFGKRRVESLSGGQQQRIAIARALVNRPKVLLLAEPLGALDLKLRQEMQLELKGMQQKLGITFIYVTHDQEEALTMSDTIVVMSEGEIQQIGSPIGIYDEPKNAFVANFIGESNIFPGTMLRDEFVHFLGQDFVCVDSGFGENMPVDVVVRPEDVEISKSGDAPLTGAVESVLFKGVHYEIICRTAQASMKIHTIKKFAPGDAVRLSVIPEYIHIMRKGRDA